jgi:hypothetical protein
MDDTLTAGTRTLLAPPTAPALSSGKGTRSAGDSGSVATFENAPSFVWENPMAATAPVMHSVPASAPAWMDDFLNHAGKTEEQRNPNASLRISIPPVAMKPAANLKPQLGAFPGKGGAS